MLLEGVEHIATRILLKRVWQGKREGELSFPFQFYALLYELHCLALKHETKNVNSSKVDPSTSHYFRQTTYVSHTESLRLALSASSPASPQPSPVARVNAIPFDS